MDVRFQRHFLPDTASCFPTRAEQSADAGACDDCFHRERMRVLSFIRLSPRKCSGSACSLSVDTPPPPRLFSQTCFSDFSGCMHNGLLFCVCLIQNRSSKFSQFTHEL